MSGKSRKPPAGRRKRPNRKKQRIRFLCCLYSVCALLLAGVCYAALYRYVHKVDEDVICSHIYIGQTEVSGMTAEQAALAVNADLEVQRGRTVDLQIGEKSAQVSLGELGLQIQDVEKLTREAADYGKKGSLLTRWKQMRRAKKTPYRTAAVYSLDEKTAEKAIEEKTAPLEQRAVDATIVRRGGSFEITDEAEGRKINAAKAVQDLTALLNGDWNYGDLTLKLTEETEEPAVRRADLESITDELGSYSTEAGYGDRVTNLRRGAELLNGRVLMPGEELSVLDATMPYTEENGYVDGGAYENGQVVESIAGGICQVSTTLYNAVLYAELEVVHRNAHSIIVSYVDPSRDAAVAEGVKDFIFRNNYDSPIYIEGYIDADDLLQFHIYGKETRPEGHTVEYESETLERMEYTTVYVEDAEREIGYMDTEGTPINGRTARLWKIVYQDGQEQSREIINESYYQPTQVKVLVGTASDNPQATALVQGAISSQNEGKIQAAIGEAQSLGQGVQE